LKIIILRNIILGFGHPGSYENYNVPCVLKNMVKLALCTTWDNVGWEGAFGAIVPLIVNFGPSCGEVVTFTPQQGSDTWERSLRQSQRS